MPEFETQIVILGASFAGVELVYQLLRLAEGRPPSMIVVDRQSAHGYLPLVQERLSRVLPPEQTMLDTAGYVRSVPGATFIQDEVVSVDPETKQVELGSGTRIRARFVVVALGSVVEPPPSMPGGEHLRTYKAEAELQDAAAALDALLSKAEELPRVAVIGGGVSGVELAGELAALSKTAPPGWTPPRVTLVTDAPRLLPGMHPRVAARVQQALRAQTVEIRTSHRLVAATAQDLTLEGEGTGRQTLASDLTFWAGGIRPAPILARLGLPLTEQGWLSVGPTLQCFATPEPTRPDIFACGDAVRVQGGTGPWNTMPRAIEAIWQAKLVAKNLLALHAEPPDYPEGVPPLRPHDLRETFFYGVSVGARSLIVYRSLVLDVPGLTHRFRRWLMRRYFERYRPLPALVASKSSNTAVTSEPASIEPGDDRS